MLYKDFNYILNYAFSRVYNLNIVSAFFLSLLGNDWCDNKENRYHFDYIIIKEVYVEVSLVL